MPKRQALAMASWARTLSSLLYSLLFSSLVCLFENVLENAIFVVLLVAVVALIYNPSEPS